MKALSSRAVWCLRFILGLIREIINAIIDVCHRCVTGNIDPYVAHVKTVLKRPVAQVLLANSITYTPGTVSADIVKENGYDVILVGTISPRPDPAIIPLEPHLKRWLE